jgi:hypothetical protein
MLGLKIQLKCLNCSNINQDPEDEKLDYNDDPDEPETYKWLKRSSY